jgi:hypothetical protein
MPLNGLRRTGNATPPTPDLLEPGRIANTPADLNAEVYVTLDNFITDQPIGPVRGWQPHYQVTPAAGEDPLTVDVLLPQEGDTCLVAQPATADADPWLVAWEAA